MDVVHVTTLHTASGLVLCLVPLFLSLPALPTYPPSPSDLLAFDPQLFWPRSVLGIGITHILIPFVHVGESTDKQMQRTTYSYV